MARINGTAGPDVLNGTAFNDTINGLAGADAMSGGLGKDIYYIDNILDTVTENLGEGTDWIYTSVSFLASANVEHMKLLGTADLDLTGNSSDNILQGNRGNNILNGGTGSDTLIGGAGNDSYIINQFDDDGINDGRGGGDFIKDTAGTDTVFALGLSIDVNYIMQRGLENLTFTSATNTMTITGNSGRNHIITGDMDDTLDGGRGADILDGGDGANTYKVDNKDDLIIDATDDFDVDGVTLLSTADILEVSARYTLSPAAQVETVSLTGTRGVDFTGSNTRNVIFGSEGRDQIRGGGGDDLLNFGPRDIAFGGTGADTFTFTGEADDYQGRPVQIRDFSLADDDVIDVSQLIEFTDGDILARYLEIIDRGNDSIIRVNTDGDGDPRNFTVVGIIYGTTGLTGEVALVSAGNLIVVEP